MLPNDLVTAEQARMMLANVDAGLGYGRIELVGAATALARTVIALEADRDRWMVGCENKRMERIALVDALITVKLLADGKLPAPPEWTGDSEEDQAIRSVLDALADRAALRALLADVMESLKRTTQDDDTSDPDYEAAVESACNGVGYGALMAAAQRCWRRSAAKVGDPVGGEAVAGPCRATVDRWLAEWEKLNRPG